jgi:hypothetical protein
MFGDWVYVEVDGALCRDGSKAGYYVKPSASGSNNLLFFLNGGGVCYDDFFCAINPKNVNESLPGETLLAATGDIVSGALLPQRQVPSDEGIFKNDPRNPVGAWNMVFVPYCTGDVHGGTRTDAPVPGAITVGLQQFVGYLNIGLFLESFGPHFRAADKVLLAGSSAGGFGTLLNFDRTQTFFRESQVFAVTDSGIPFRDSYLEPCLQQQWRNLWGLDAALPAACKGCFQKDGGGLAEGLGHYIFREKYPGRMLGGGVSSEQDEVMKLFFSLGLNECTTSGLIEAAPAAFGLGSYPRERYPAGLKDFITNVAGESSIGSYLMTGSLHQHLFRARFYQESGTDGTLAAWLSDILDSKAVHLGSI